MLAVTIGFALWLCGRLAVGYLPLPSLRTLRWVGVLAALAGVSAYAAPLSAYAVPSGHVWVAALWIFGVIAALSKDDRSGVDQAVRAAGWVMVLLAFYQYFRYGIDRPYASLLNQNCFAGAILMLLPLAAQKQDWALAGGLLVCLWWSHSVGAWLGLAAALVVVRRTGAAGFWAGCAAGFICLVAIYGKLQSPEVLHRWQWWLSAARMAWERPWFGFGPGTFAYVLPAYQEPGRGLTSLFAHQHFLETAAELGLPFMSIWTFGILRCLKRGSPHKRFAALAVLVQSLWDYSLSIPGNLWLFSYCAASTVPESSRAVNVPARWKLPACLLVLGVAGVACRFLWLRWDADLLRARAVEEARAGAPAERVMALLERSRQVSEHPETTRLAAEVELRLAQSDPRPERLLLSAAEHLQSSVRLDPYRASTWRALEGVYAQLGRPDLAREARLAGAATCPGLRLP